MRPPPFLLRFIAQRFEARQMSHHRDPRPLQEAILRRIVNRYSATELGRWLGLARVHDSASFRAQVPVKTCDDYAPLWQRVFDTNEAGLVYPEKLEFMAQSSGTSGKIKRMPCPKELLAVYRRYSNQAFFHAFIELDNYTLLAKNILITSAPPVIERTKNGLTIGYGSGLATMNGPRFAREMVRPSPEILGITEWQSKIERTIEEAFLLDIRILTGIPLAVVPLLEQLLRKAKELGLPAQCATDIWPNLRMYTYSGTPVGFLEQRLRKLLGPQVAFFELYSSTESPIAYQYRIGTPGLLVDLAAAYYEFLPVNEPAASRIPIHEVKPGQRYDIIITTEGGLFAYRLGDQVEFLSVDPYVLCFAGRESEEMSLGGEKVAYSDVQKALQVAAQRFKVEIVEFFICPQVAQESHRAAYEWHIEFSKDPSELADFIRCADEALQEANGLYKYYREKNNYLGAPTLVPLKPGTLANFQKSHTTFGQGKFPHLYNSREIPEKILATVMKESRDKV